MFRKFASSLTGATILLTLLLFLGRGFGFLREILFANFFGSGKNFEIYLIGAVIPVTINVIVYFIAQNFFIPIYNEIKLKDVEKARDMTIQYFWIFFFAGIIFVIVLLLISGSLVKIYLGDVPQQVLNSTTIIFNIILFSIPLNAGYSILANYLNAEFKYIHPAISQLCLNITVILFIILIPTMLGIYIIPIGILTGYIFQLLYVLIVSKLNYKFSYIHLKSYFTRPGNYKSTLAIVILIEGVSQLYNIIDRYYFNQVDPGGLAALNYSMNLYLLPISIISMAFATVMFPKFSQAISQRNVDKLGFYFNKAMIINAAIFIPIMIFFFFEGNVLVKLIYERGKFDSFDTIRSFRILQIFATSLLFYSSFAIINKIIYGFKEVKYLLIVSIGCILLKIILNAILVGKLHQNGLALSTSISYMVMSLLGYYFVNLKLGSKSTIKLIKYFFQLTAIGIFALIMNSLFIWTSELKIISYSGIYIISVLFLWDINFYSKYIDGVIF
jgi:putative peptidoglycan lipid II flippase